MTESVIGGLTATAPLSFSVVRCASRAGGASSALATILSDRPALLLVSGSVQRHYSGLIRQLEADNSLGVQAVLPVPTGEEHKTLSTVEGILSYAEELKFSRRGVFVAVGGGVLLDTVALAASLYKRGVPVVKVGTTLVAQVDAAIGIKCGVNTSGGKNLAGTFYAPEAVLVDGAFLKTLPVRHMRCGLAEMVKLAIATDARLFSQLECDAASLLTSPRDGLAARRLADRAIKGMLAELKSNVYERDLKRAVDFGHTVSPALEVVTQYRMHHGEAVALDVALFTVAACLLGLTPRENIDRVLRLFEGLGLDRWHPLLENRSFLGKALATAETHRGMALNAPLPTCIGTVTFVEERASLPLDVLVAAAQLLRRWPG